MLLRHGKSDWAADFGLDRERPLAPRGRRAASRVGQFVSAAGWVPQRVLTSPARRAARTVERAAEAGGWLSVQEDGSHCQIVVEEALYDSTPERVLHVLHQQPSDVERLLLAGHEPTWSQLASRLTGGGRLRVPTAALVGIRFEVETWADVGFGDGELLFLLPPRLLDTRE